VERSRNIYLWLPIPDSCAITSYVAGGRKSGHSNYLSQLGASDRSLIAMVRGAAIWSDVWEDYQHYSRGGPHQAAVFVSGSARTQLKRRLIASCNQSSPEALI